jgi:hypothetical protein
VRGTRIPHNDGTRIGNYARQLDQSRFAGDVERTTPGHEIA